jgi:hypothetical protein
MGGMKRWLEEATEGGLDLFAAEGQFVCSRCFRRGPLRQVVRMRRTVGSCSFCARGGGIVAPLAEVVKYVSECLHHHYDDAANCLYYDGGEGGYQGTTFDSDELLSESGFHDELSDDDSGLAALVGEALGDRSWCEQNPYGLRRHEHLTLSWENFCAAIKHEQRFFFPKASRRLRDPLDWDAPLEPVPMLEALVGAVLALRLVVKLPMGSPLFRARLQPAGVSLAGALDLGAPPPSLATQTNRMSPPGLAMTYLAFDQNTALDEVLAPTSPTSRRSTYVVGEFRLARELPILDLTRIPAIPSMFDLKQRRKRDATIFLRKFEHDVSKAIARDDRVHVEYIPTQVVTEYLRSHPRLRNAGVLGIRYRSARDRNSANLVMFGGRELVQLSEHERSQLESAERFKSATVRPCLRLARRSEVRR